MSDLAHVRAFDNPFRARALRMTFRPGRLTVTLMLHAAVLLPVLYSVNFFYSARIQGTPSEFRIPFGNILLAALAFVEGFFLTLSVPFRCGMILYADRRNRCLDQLTGCGLSPVTICWGHLTAVMAAVAMHLLCALPYFGLCVLLGKLPVAPVAATLAVLFFYALALGCVAMALGVLRGFVAPFMLILLVFLSIAPGVIPDSEGMPSAVAALCPVRPLLLTAFDSWRPFLREYSHPRIWGATIPCWLLSCAYYVFLSFVAYAYLLIGPDVRLAPGMNDFGAVTLGRKKRKRMGRSSRALLRKVQLAFLYENRPAWLKRWSCRLREALALALFTLVFAVAAGLLAPHVRATTAPSKLGSVAKVYLEKPTYQSYQSFGYQEDDALISYSVMALLWMAVILPYTRRHSRPRVEHAVEHGLRTPLDWPAFWHGLALLMPAGLIVLAMSLAGKPLALLCWPYALGLWLTGAAYSLTVGSLVSLCAAYARYPRARHHIALVFVVGLLMAPFLWVPLFYFRLAPEWACHSTLGSVLAAIPMTIEPWETMRFSRIVGPPLIWSPDWRYVLLLYSCAAVVAVSWDSVVLRRLRTREEAERMARARVGAAD